MESTRKTQVGESVRNIRWLITALCPTGIGDPNII